MMIMIKARWRNLLPLAFFAALIALMTAGCSSNKTVPAPSAGGATGSSLVINNPNAPAELKAQAQQQQQIGQQQSQALLQAHERETASGQNKGQ